MTDASESIDLDEGLRQSAAGETVSLGSFAKYADAIDLAELRKLALAATPGPWERGDHWHIQGSDSCQCSERHGPLVEERQMNINGTMMDAHVHRSEKPWWEHGIYSEVRQGGSPVNVVNDTQEYGLMADTDAEFIAAANPSTVLALIERAESAERRIEKAEDFITRHYLDTDMGERVLAILAGEDDDTNA